MVGGPLFTLRLWGLFCPCIQKDEDKSARQSLMQLNELGARVDWHTSPKRNVGALATGFVQSLFGGRSSSTTSISQSHTDEKPPTPAQLRLVDATKDSINWGEPYPELQLIPLPQTSQQQPQPDDAVAGGPVSPLGGLMKQNAMSYQLDIPLHHIVKIESIEPTMLVIITKDVHSTNENAPTEKEAARISFPSSDTRDTVSLDLKVLVEWNKQRQPDIEEDMPATGIRQRAQKAAHFAKREIEMREKKREREKRKSQHMQGGAGLKYTAMAMANQSK
ncbi:hypothetical protein IV203_023156 [Nitzschia inconspicua]|uniref:Uncharacterized protein n=1 Tax=Nitzschia inconspicua TaxID=303405 RepID=A0A9K3KDJ8_9STRA|nr:hypothetical protein IV203_023156 [Nitzschia inconspicua]